MQKQYILNRRLHRMHNYEQNIYLNSKIKRAKSYVDINCPESFTFHRGEFKKGLTRDFCNNNFLIFYFYSKKKGTL